METLKRTLYNRLISGLLQSLSLILFLSSLNSLSLNAQTLKGSHQHEPQSIIRAKVQQIYTSQIGIREKQPNAGTAVEKYLAYVNLPKGNPWCAAFVCWVYGRARVGNPRSGWSPDLFREGRVIWEREPRTKSQEPRFPPSVSLEQRTKSKEQRFPPIVPSTYASSLATGNWQQVTPGPGDIFGLFFPEKARIAHVGFIDQWDGTWLTTVEGNTNISGSREGDGVYRKRRLVISIYKVARYIY